MWRRLIYHPEVNYALRQTLVLCLPVAIGLLLGHLQQRLDSDGPGSAGDANIMESPESEAPIGPLSTLEQHLQRILGHLNTMHTISSVAWRQRPHHGIWLRKISR